MPVAIKNASNRELWESWKNAIDEFAREPENKALENEVDRLEDEVIRRMKVAADCAGSKVRPALP